MKNVRLFAAVCATMFAASVSFAGGEECQKAAKDTAKSGCCSAAKEKACCPGSETAKGGAEDAGKDAKTAGDCAKKCASDKTAACTAGAEAKGGAEDAGKDGKSAGDCAAKCASDKTACTAGSDAKGGAEDAAKGEGFSIGQKPPTITLTDAVSGSQAPLVDDKAAATVLIFWNQSCPFVVEAQDRVAAYTKEAGAKNVRVVAIDANDPGKANSAEKVKEYASTRPFSVLLNPDSSVAASFGASRTPEAFVLDKNGVVQYHGAFDGGAKDPSKTFVADAVAAVLDGKTPEVTTSKAFGCTIKFSDSVAKNAVKEVKEDAKAKMGEARQTRKEAKVGMKAKSEKKVQATAEAVEMVETAEVAPKN